MSENWLRCKLWFPLIEKAEIRRLDLHAARHTFASHVIANGENLQYIAEQIGHSSIKVTADTYGHLILGGNRQAVDRLDKVSDRGDLKPNRDVSSLAEAKSLVL
ncbi:MAG: tyrosine-type recombinase/integrase [Nitrospirae bacterium]|nr:tyrosine-type recombinase/integrase [Nitrospirota bacterium]